MNTKNKGVRPPNAKKGEFRGERAVEAQKKATEARKRNLLLRDTLVTLMAKSPSDETIDSLQQAIGNKLGNISIGEAVALAQLIKAMQGDTTAAAWVRDTSGEKPTDKVAVDQDKPFQVNIKVIE